MNKRLWLLVSVLLCLLGVSTEVRAGSGSYTVTIKVVGQAYNQNLGRTLSFDMDRSCYSEDSVISVSIPNQLCLSCFQQASTTLNFNDPCGHLHVVKFKVNGSLIAQFTIPGPDATINQTHELDFDFGTMKYVLKRIL
ncbi:MAG: hypothetical protein K4571_17020 [Deltaproteobacteria bacterium]